ncbi:MAG TPA: cupredoxin family copper-binding protein [Aliidongia sp.]|nr:cupredoxin family copper-binding protein [Aliidongia sp.]
MFRNCFAALMVGALSLVSASAFAEDAKVTIDNFTFTPSELHVAVGSNVTWTNNDDIPHTVVDADTPKTTKSPPLDTGDHYSRVFDKPGTYHYFCSLHPHMQGTVVVQ